VFDQLTRRAWPLLTTVLLLASGMAFSLFWAPVVRHHSYWVIPGDIWGTYRSAHFIGWGYLGGVYSAGTGLVTFPGILLAFAPIAMLTGALGLSESFPKTLAHPTAWLALGPAELVLSAVALFATDALAERLGVSWRRRAVLCLAEGAFLWNVSAGWGHPEDAVAVGLALYALLLGLDGRWTGSGWLFGAAMATQPLVVLMLPILLAMAGRQRAIGMLTRSLLPVGALMATPLIAQFHPTIHAVMDQPNFPFVDHATPWTSLAPRLAGSGKSLAVAGGPGRLLALVLACGLGIGARRWRGDPRMLVWAAALAMALRCFTESVMDSFYVWPVLAIALIVVAEESWLRLVCVGLLAMSLTVVSNWRLGELPWWGLVTGGLVLVLAGGITRRRPVTFLSSGADHVPMTDEDAKSAFRIGTRAPELVGASR
jgi:hypothetical protein